MTEAKEKQPNEQEKTMRWWRLSWFLSVVLAACLISIWVHMAEYKLMPSQLMNERSVDEYLASNWDEKLATQEGGDVPLLKLKTGIFIQSLQFFESTEVNISGYIWQRYENGVHDKIKPDKEGVGFILPEQVNSISSVPVQIYRHVYDDEEVIGWYFEATLKQPFDYSLYPFDHKTVWVRLWSNDFFRNVLLVPDFESYKATGPDAIFGIEEEIVLDTWDRENTFFNYRIASYDTNFGIKNHIGQSGIPELHYNFVIKRKFNNAFIVYLLPLFLVAALLFAALLTVSEHKELSSRFGFSTSGFISASSALFFVVMLAHIQLRQQFAGSSIVYIEYFYILMYMLLVVATVNTYLFSVRSNFLGTLIRYNDNIIPKITYWPTVISCLILISLYMLWS